MGWITHPDVYDPPEESVQYDWVLVMRAKQLSSWTGESLYSILRRMVSDDKQERDLTQKLWEWMDIHRAAQDEYRKQGQVK